MKTETPPVQVCIVISCLLILSVFPLTAEAQPTHFEMVQMPDGILLATDVCLPEGSGPFPTVLIRTPYGRNCIDEVDYLAEEYAVVSQDTRGTGESHGSWNFWKDEPSDGHATIEWIAVQSWSNAKVGMVGRSARGAVQYAVAQNAPSALKCLAPAHESPDRYHHVVFPGGALFEDLVVGWMTDFYLIHLLPDALAHRLLDSWWDGLNWVESPETIDVPIFHMGRWYDLFHPGAPHAFQVIQHQGGNNAAGNQYLLMDPLDHFRRYGQHGFNHPPTQIPFEDYRHQLQLDWLAYWLKDEATGVDDWPHVRIYLMGPWEEPGAPGNTWIEMDDWPPRAETLALYISHDGQSGTLSEVVPQAGQQVLHIDPEFDPVPTYGGGNYDEPSGPRDQAAYPVSRPIESRDDVLTFTTDVLTQPVYVMGAVTANIWIRPDTPDFDLSVRLTDVYPDGRSMLITDGLQRARMRCGDDQECFMTPGEEYEIEVAVGSTAMVFNAGHRIRLAIAGTNYTRRERNTNDGGDLNDPNYIVANPEILFGPEYPTAVMLPIPVVFSDSFESGDTSHWSGTVP